MMEGCYVQAVQLAIERYRRTHNGDVPAMICMSHDHFAQALLEATRYFDPRKPNRQMLDPSEFKVSGVTVRRLEPGVIAVGD